MTSKGSTIFIAKFVSYTYYLLMEIINKCETCSATFRANIKEIKRGNGRFCSLSCSSSRKRVKNNTTCANCGTGVYRNTSKQKGSKSKLFFCSRSCKDSAQKLGGISEIMPKHYGTGKESYRKKFDVSLLECSRCGYNEFSCAVEIHHKDEDRNNNTIDNLLALCANCHRGLHNNKWVS